MTDMPTPRSGSDRPLPYGPRMSRMLPLLHRSFLVANRGFAAPALRAGLGPFFVAPFGGSILLLRTRGRRTGTVREAPLGYLVHDGAVYVCAGFGRSTGWLANITTDPAVDVVLPGARFRGHAQEVTDRAEFTAVLPLLIHALGAVGRATVPDAAALADGGAEAWFGPLPLVRIRLTAILPGTWDPGGHGWVGLAGLELAMAALLLVAAGRWSTRDRRRP